VKNKTTLSNYHGCDENAVSVTRASYRRVEQCVSINQGA